MNFPWLTRGDRQHGLHSKALRPETGAEGGAQAGKREEKDSGPPPQVQESWGKEMETKPGGEGESGGGRTTVQGRG